MPENQLSESNRIFIDLFGPIINIEHLAPFRDVYGARYLSITSLVDTVNSTLNAKLQGHWFPKIDQQFVLETCRQALTHIEYHPDMIDQDIMANLCTAIKAGTDVVIISTVPDETVFNAAVNCLTNYVRVIFGISKDSIKFERATKDNTWRDILNRYKNKDERFTYVIHDMPAEEFGMENETSYNQWAPSSRGSPNLAAVIADTLMKEGQDAPKKWLKGNERIELDNYKAFGNFLVFDANQRDKIVAIVNQLKTKEKRPTCVFLGGPPGSGKSFFVEQFRRQLQGCGVTPSVVSNISGVGDLENALRTHVKKISSSDPKTKVAFIDEIDTAVLKTLSFRFLLAPMDGTVFDENGFEVDEKFGDFVWFFAGSAGRDRDDFHKLDSEERKVRDFTSRISHWIELPGASTPNDAMFMGLTLLKNGDPKITQIEKKILLLFARVPWRDARHLRTSVEIILSNARKRATKKLGFAGVCAALRDNIDIDSRVIDEVSGIELVGYLEII